VAIKFSVGWNEQGNSIIGLVALSRWLTLCFGSIGRYTEINSAKVNKYWKILFVVPDVLRIYAITPTWR
jgi:hypothetical protein